MNMLNKELKKLGQEELQAKVEELRGQLFQLRLQTATQHVKSYPSTKKALKSAIACGLTRLREMELAEFANKGAK